MRTREIRLSIFFGGQGRPRDTGLGPGNCVVRNRPGQATRCCHERGTLKRLACAGCARRRVCWCRAARQRLLCAGGACACAESLDSGYKTAGPGCIIGIAQTGRRESIGPAWCGGPLPAAVGGPTPSEALRVSLNPSRPGAAQSSTCAPCAATPSEATTGRCRRRFADQPDSDEGTARLGCCTADQEGEHGPGSGWHTLALPCGT